jgi:hypothetical protein
MWRRGLSAAAQFAEQFSRGDAVRLGFRPPQQVPTSALQLHHLETVHKTIELYLWLRCAVCRFVIRVPTATAAATASTTCSPIARQRMPPRPCASTSFRTVRGPAAAP